MPHFYRGRIDRARRIVEELLELGERRRRNPRLFAQAHL